MRQKSKYVFLIMCFVYFFIGVSSCFDLIPVNSNVLFGLSLSSLLMSISDIFNNFIIKISSQNDLNLLVKRTSEFVDSKIKSGAPSINPSIFTHNVKKNMEMMCPRFKNAKSSQNELNKTFYMTSYNLFKYIFFISSITVFIIVPFIKQSIVMDEKITVIVTIVAFASMCFNLFVSEQIEDIAQIKLNFHLDKLALINLAYPDYQNYIFQLNNSISNENNVEG